MINFWKTGIISAIILFMGFILSMVVYASTKKIDLISEDYYQKEIEYQTEINAISNYNQLNNAWKINQDADKLVLLPPEKLVREGATHTIQLCRLNDSSLDLKRASTILKLRSQNMNSLKGTISSRYLPHY